MFIADWTPHYQTKNSYLFVSDEEIYDDAVTLCLAHGSHLATIDNMDADTFLVSVLDKYVPSVAASYYII